MPSSQAQNREEQICTLPAAGPSARMAAEGCMHSRLPAGRLPASTPQKQVGSGCRSARPGCRLPADAPAQAAPAQPSRSRSWHRRQVGWALPQHRPCQRPLCPAHRACAGGRAHSHPPGAHRAAQRERRVSPASHSRRRRPRRAQGRSFGRAPRWRLHRRCSCAPRTLPVQSRRCTPGCAHEPRQARRRLHAHQPRAAARQAGGRQRPHLRQGRVRGARGAVPVLPVGRCQAGQRHQ